MTALLDRGYFVLIETSGSCNIHQVDSRVVIIMDIKCPSSGMEETVCWDNIKWLKPKDEVKFVIANRGDYDWAHGVMVAYPSLYQHTLLFSPVFGEMEARQLAEWILADNLQVRLQLQAHKYIWAPDQRGV